MHVQYNLAVRLTSILSVHQTQHSSLSILALADTMLYNICSNFTIIRCILYFDSNSELLSILGSSSILPVSPSSFIFLSCSVSYFSLSSIVSCSICSAVIFPFIGITICPHDAALFLFCICSFQLGFVSAIVSSCLVLLLLSFLASSRSTSVSPGVIWDSLLEHFLTQQVALITGAFNRQLR